MKHLPRVGALLCISVMFSSAHALCDGKNQPTKIKASAIQVAMIQSDETSVPAEFRVALYENLIRQLEKRGFQSVYRDGDRNSASVADLVVLHSTVRRFKRGNEEARQVTTVAGATSISVHCQFTNADGQTLLERDVTGKVRFFGGNLRATYDLQRRPAKSRTKTFPLPTASDWGTESHALYGVSNHA